MSSVRIRYAKTEETNVVESTRVFEAQGNKYKVRLNKAELSYVVFNVDSEIIAASGTAVSSQILKRRVKSALEELGVSFSTETRNRQPAQVATEVVA